MKELKIKISEDWQTALPQLTQFSKNKYYKILGPLIIGIELIELPRVNSYRPYFVIYALWGNKMGNDLKACLSGPILLKEYYDKRGFQFSIPYDKHIFFFDSVLESINENTPLSFEGDVSLKQLFNLIDDYSMSKPLSAASNSYLQAALLAAKFEIALFTGIAQAQNVLEQINQRNWDNVSFNMWNIDLKTWLQDLNVKLSNREFLLRQIELNMEDKEIARLNSSKLTT